MAALHTMNATPQRRGGPQHICTCLQHTVDIASVAQVFQSHRVAAVLQAARHSRRWAREGRRGQGCGGRRRETCRHGAPCRCWLAVPACSGSRQRAIGRHRHTPSMVMASPPVAGAEQPGQPCAGTLPTLRCASAGSEPSVPTTSAWQRQGVGGERCSAALRPPCSDHRQRMISSELHAQHGWLVWNATWRVNLACRSAHASPVPTWRAHSPALRWLSGAGTRPHRQLGLAVLPCSRVRQRGGRSVAGGWHPGRACVRRLAWRQCATANYHSLAHARCAGSRLAAARYVQLPDRGAAAGSGAAAAYLAALGVAGAVRLERPQQILAVQGVHAIG